MTNDELDRIAAKVAERLGPRLDAFDVALHAINKQLAALGRAIGRVRDTLRAFMAEGEGDEVEDARRARDVEILRTQTGLLRGLRDRLGALWSWAFSSAGRGWLVAFMLATAGTLNEALSDYPFLSSLFSGIVRLVTSVSTPGVSP